ncbi:MAG: hypothetical protein LBO81_01290, partial [Clostridiales Family XIII bacterium]|nr:hypothetical protein [Clostridiales Family XIII bacterium]
MNIFRKRKKSKDAEIRPSGPRVMTGTAYGERPRGAAAMRAFGVRGGNRARRSAIAILLCVVMAVGFVPIPTNAESANPSTGAIAIFVDKSIVTGNPITTENIPSNPSLSGTYTLPALTAGPADLYPMSIQVVYLTTSPTNNPSPNQIFAYAEDSFDFGTIPATWAGATVSVTVQLGSLYQSEYLGQFYQYLSGSCTIRNMGTGAQLSKTFDSGFRPEVSPGGVRLWIAVGATVTLYGTQSPPVVTADNLTKNVGDAFAQTEGVNAQSGINGTKFSGFGGTYNGTVTRSGGVAVPVSGGKLTSVGIYAQTFTAKDNTDNTTAQASRNVTVKTAAAPALSIAYAAGATDADGNPIGGQAYASGTWTNQDLIATVTGGDILGTFRNAVYDSVNPSAYSTGTAGSESAATAAVKTYNANTAVGGTDVRGVLLAESGTELLSAPTAARTVRIDKDAPSPDVQYNPLAGTFTDTSADALSGVEAGRTRMLVVPADNPGSVDTNEIGNYVPADDIVIGAPGAYDIYVWAFDRAGNAAHALAEEDIVLASSDAPFIGGSLTGSGAAHPSGAWTNQDVRVRVENNPALGAANFLVLHEGDRAVTAATAANRQAGGTYDLGAERVYNAETPAAGISLFGLLSDQDDGTGVALSARTENYTVRIDKTAPIPAVTYDPLANAFTDTSSDALSGIDAAGTKILLLPAGASPASGALDDADNYMPIGTPITKPGSYDVYVYAKDNAGNAAHAKMSGSVSVRTTDAPLIGGRIGFNAHPSDTWTNKAVTVTVIKGAIETDGVSFLSLYETALPNPVFKHSGLPNVWAEAFYDAETAGTALFGVLTDEANVAGSALTAHELSERTGSYTVKIDRTKPVADLTYNYTAKTFTDMSTDTD